MSSETDVAPKAISGWDWVGLEISVKSESETNEKVTAFKSKVERCQKRLDFPTNQH